MIFFLVNCIVIACKKLSGYKTWQKSCGHKDMKVYWYSTIFSCLFMIVSTVHLARCSSKTYSLKNVSMSARWSNIGIWITYSNLDETNICIVRYYVSDDRFSSTLVYLLFVILSELIHRSLKCISYQNILCFLPCTISCMLINSACLEMDRKELWI